MLQVAIVAGLPSLDVVPSLLLIEDDATVREATATFLRHAGYAVTTVADGALGVDVVARESIDLVLLDLMLPGLGGLDVCRRLRDLRPGLPVIMVTARGQEHERVQGLSAGADDYVTKPFSARELELRIRGVLRRSLGAGPGVLAATELVDGGLRLDVVGRRVYDGASEIYCTAREFDLLLFLLRNPGAVFSRDDLMRQVWGWEVGDATTVTVHVRRVREKIEADPSRPVRLVTVFGRGYRWDRADSAGVDRLRGGPASWAGPVGGAAGLVGGAAGLDGE